MHVQARVNSIDENLLIIAGNEIANSSENNEIINIKIEIKSFQFTS